MNTTRPIGASPLARVPAAVLAASALLLAASAVTATDAAQPTSPTECWTDEPGIVGTIDHPAQASAIVLRMFTGGGFVPVEIRFMENPVFTLYGNDVAIFRPAGEPESLTDPLVPYACARLTPDQVDELLAFALDDGGLRDADDRYANPFIVDTPNTVFTIDADGIAKDVVVEALGFDPDAPDAEERAHFSLLADLLTDFGPEVDDAQPFEVPRYRGLLTEAWAELPGTPQPWPWADLSVDDFSGDGFATATLTPDQVGQVTSIPNGGQGYLLLELPDGSVGSLTVAPLLPDQEPIG